jgi:aspartyl-tRNA(Asn)/glutamyl-tRNA(Gln) amidotransferase subunit A
MGIWRRVPSRVFLVRMTTDEDSIALPVLPGDPGSAGLSRRSFLAGGAVAGVAMMPLLDPSLADAAGGHRSRRRKNPAHTHKKRKQRPVGHAAVPEGLPDPEPIYARHANPADLGTLEAASLLHAGLLSSGELTSACQARISARNGPVSFSGSPTTINAWIRLYPSLADQGAAAADAAFGEARKRRELAPLLCGVPIGLKDLYAVKGLPLTASSHVLDGNVAAGDSTAWARLAAAGMVLCGHTHTDEFAFLAVTPQCGNPWNTGLITGGSSGGSAAALAARMVPAAMGSDTLGSLRIPAAFCGVSSVKPTFGLVSAAGVIPLAWALDHCGPMGRSVGDCSLVLSTLAGEDVNDPSTDVADAVPVRYPTLPRTGSRPLAGTRIGIPMGLGTPDAGPGEIYSRTCDELASLGATLIDVTVPTNPFDPDTGPLEFYTDALSYHRHWFPSKITSYKAPAAQMLTAIQALNLSALDYLSLHRQRAAYQAAWKERFAEQNLDAIVLLVSLSDPLQRADPELASPVTNPENSKLLTFPFSYLGFPVVTVPGGASSSTHVPVGIQIAGAPFSEATLIQMAVDLQAHFPHFEEQPPSLPATPLPASALPTTPLPAGGLPTITLPNPGTL